MIELQLYSTRLLKMLGCKHVLRGCLTSVR